MKTALATLALIFSVQAFATEAYLPVEKSRVSFDAVSQEGFSATPWKITTKPIKIKNRIFVGTDVGLYQITQTAPGRFHGTVAYTDCRAIPDYKYLDCQGIEDLTASETNLTHARVSLSQNGVMEDLFLGVGYTLVGTNATRYFGSM